MPSADKRGHQVLDGADAGGGHVGIGQDGAQAGVDDVVEAGGESARFRSVRRKTMPWSAAAGRMVRLTRRPEWTPTPTQSIAVFRVRCRHPEDASD